MDLCILRSCVISDYNTRASTKVKLLDKCDYMSSMSHDPSINISTAYVNSLERLIYQAFWALIDKNYHKSKALLMKYRKATASIISECEKMSNSSNEVNALESKIQFSEVKNNTWTRMSEFMGAKNDKGFIALKNRINVYNTNIRNQSNIIYKINYLKALIKDIDHFWEYTKKALNKSSISDIDYVDKAVRKKVNNNDISLEDPELIINGGATTPEINFSTKYNYFSIKGRSNPGDVDGFWKSIIDWLSHKFEIGDITNKSTLEINLDYMSSRTSAYILKILKIFNLGRSNVNWFYESGDDSMFDDINSFKGFIPDLNLHIIEIDVRH